MPRPTIQLRIAQPCPESWSAMTPTGPGRHCAACQKVVVDFSHKTDSEILAYLARAGSSPCGRFRADQLARPLHPAAPVSRWRSWLASILAVGGVLGSGRAAAQAGGGYFSAGPTPTVARPASPEAGTAPVPATPVSAAAPAAPGGPMVLRGVVLEAPSGDRLLGVTVLLKGTTHGVSTDAEGAFVFELSAAAANGTLVVSSVGYTHQELPVASVAGAAPATIKLEADTHVLGGEIAIVGGYSVRKPWPWYPRALYHRAKYLAMRPFQQ